MSILNDVTDEKQIRKRVIKSLQSPIVEVFGLSELVGISGHGV